MRTLDYDEELNFKQFDSKEIDQGSFDDKKEELKILFTSDLRAALHSSYLWQSPHKYNDIILDYLRSDSTYESAANYIECCLNYLNDCGYDKIRDVNKKRKFRMTKRSKTYKPYFASVFKSYNNFLRRKLKAKIWHINRGEFLGKEEWNKVSIAWKVFRRMIRRYYYIKMPKWMDAKLYTEISVVCPVISEYYHYVGDKERKPYKRMSECKKSAMKSLGEQAAAMLVVDELRRMSGRFGDLGN